MRTCLKIGVMGVVERGLVAVQEDGSFSGYPQDMLLLKELSNIFGLINVLSVGYFPEHPEYDIHKTRLRSKYNIANVKNTVLELPNEGIIGRIKWIKHLKTIWNYAGNCNTVLIYMPSTLGIIATFIATARRKLIVSYYGSKWENSYPSTYEKYFNTQKRNGKLKSVLKKMLEIISYKLSNLLLIRDPGLTKILRNQNKNAFYIPGNSNFKIKSVAPRLLKDKKRIEILTVCDILPVKGLDVAIKAISLLNDIGTDIRYTIVGTPYPKNVKYLKELSEELGLTNKIRFIGYVNDSREMENHYDKCDIFLLPSYSEGVPRVVFEAQSQGVPVVATLVGGLPYLMESEEDIIFVKAGCPKDIVIAINKLINNPCLVERIIKNGYQCVIRERERITSDKLIQKWLIDNFKEMS